MKKILLTGGGTGGHIYPIIAVAEKLQQVGGDDIKLIYIGPKNNLTHEFSEREITIYKITSSKLRRYFAFANFFDIPKFIFSVFEAIVKLFFIMPDVVFSKGGPGTFAVVLAARFYFIPVLLHESDSVPSLTSKLSSKFTKRIGVSFKSTLKYFPSSKTFFAGNPIRGGLLENWLDKERAKNYIGFKENEPLILVLGGSQGAAKINEFITEYLGILLAKYQLLHQVGEKNLTFVSEESKYILSKLNREEQRRYRLVSSMKLQELKFAINAADLVIARAGAGAIFEIAAFGKPSILIPLEGSAGDHQKKNAYEYADTGAALVIEESNLTKNIFFDQFKKLIEDNGRLERMSQAALRFAKPESTDIIVKEILSLAAR